MITAEERVSLEAERHFPAGAAVLCPCGQLQDNALLCFSYGKSERGENDEVGASKEEEFQLGR